MEAKQLVPFLQSKYPVPTWSQCPRLSWCIKSLFFTPQLWRASPFLLPQAFALSGTVGLFPFFPRSQHNSRISGELEMERSSVDLHSNFLLQMDWVVQSAPVIQAFIQSDLYSPPIRRSYNLSNQLYGYEKKKKKLGTEYDLQGCRKSTFTITVCEEEDGGPRATKSLGID